MDADDCSEQQMKWRADIEKLVEHWKDYRWNYCRQELLKRFDNSLLNWINLDDKLNKRIEHIP